MGAFAKSREAMQEAMYLVQRLPAHTVWALTVTNDEPDATLNIYAEREYWPGLALSLRLQQEPDDSDTSFISFVQNRLTISFIEEVHDVE